MSDYRLYCLDRDGQITLAEWIEADSDEEAITRARELRPNVYKCEIWQKNRLVAKLNSAGRFQFGDA